ncbi:MAG: exo-alpha-sialidase [Armatimonadetes bacterium]|nr:exo-alpha-sialidase [Armatimonadota bacterium]
MNLSVFIEATGLAGACLVLAAAARGGESKAIFEEIHAVKMPTAQFGYRGMPGNILPLKDGRLLMCYTDKGIIGRYSSDRGKSWGEAFTLVSNPPPPSKRGYYCHPSLLRLGNGDILLFYIYGLYPPEGSRPYYGHNYYKRSSDEGKTWSEQFIATPYPHYTISHNDKPRLLSTGRIIVPVEYKKRWPNSNDHSGYVATAFYSDDAGYTWLASKNDVDMEPHEAQEAHVAELKDGRLMMIFRTYSGFLGRAYSSDKGESWSKGELVKDLKLPANSSAVTADRIPSTGHLLLLRCTGGEGGRRTPFTACVSADEGVTWGHERPIAADPENDYGYQSLLFLDDLAILSYHKRDGLYVARIGIDWFYGQ